MKDLFIGAAVGAFLGFLAVLVVNPEFVVNSRLKSKLNAIEEVLIDQERELNKLKKRMENKNGN